MTYKVRLSSKYTTLAGTILVKLLWAAANAAIKIAARKNVNSLAIGDVPVVFGPFSSTITCVRCPDTCTPHGYSVNDLKSKMKKTA
jgi:hypothetical protein